MKLAIFTECGIRADTLIELRLTSNWNNRIARAPIDKAIPFLAAIENVKFNFTGPDVSQG
jgi:hypothetical protein